VHARCRDQSDGGTVVSSGTRSRRVAAPVCSALRGVGPRQVTDCFMCQAGAACSAAERCSPGTRGIEAGQLGVVSSFLMCRAGSSGLVRSLLDVSVDLYPASEGVVFYPDFCWSACFAIG
jgi:hypothetical protein